MSVEDPKDHSQDPDFGEFTGSADKKRAQNIPKTFENVATEAEVKLSREQLEELPLLRGFIRESYDESGILDFELIVDLIKEYNLTPPGKERPFAEFIADSVGREKKKPMNFTGKSKSLKIRRKEKQRLAKKRLMAVLRPKQSEDKQKKI